MIPDVKNPVENACDDCCSAKYEFRFTSAYDPSDPWDVCFKQCVSRNGVCPSSLTAALDQAQQQVQAQQAQQQQATQYLAPGLKVPFSTAVQAPKLAQPVAPTQTQVVAQFPSSGRYVGGLRLPGSQSVFPQGSKVMWSQADRGALTEVLVGVGVLAAVAAGGYYLFVYRKRKQRPASPNRRRRYRRGR